MRYSLADWSVFCRWEHCGLGVAELRAKNISLHGRRFFRMEDGKPRVWKEIIGAKYLWGPENNLLCPKRPSCNQFWFGLLKESTFSGKCNVKLHQMLKHVFGRMPGCGTALWNVNTEPYTPRQTQVLVKDSCANAQVNVQFRRALNHHDLMDWLTYRTRWPKLC